jgi:hypothetical protein
MSALSIAGYIAGGMGVLMVLFLVFLLGHRMGFVDGVRYTVELESNRNKPVDESVMDYTRRTLSRLRRQHMSIRDELKLDPEYQAALEEQRKQST